MTVVRKTKTQESALRWTDFRPRLVSEINSKLENVSLFDGEDTRSGAPVAKVSKRGTASEVRENTRATVAYNRS